LFFKVIEVCKVVFMWCSSN